MLGTGVMVLALAGGAAAGIPGSPAAAPASDSCTVAARGGQLHWVEATSLDVRRDPVLLWPKAGRISFPLAGGRWVVCAGAQGLPLTCGVLSPPDGETNLVIGVERGAPIRGRVLFRGKPAPDAEISVILQGLSSRIPFQMPLEVDASGGARRAITSDGKGRFATPALAPGDYRLEVRLARGPRILTDPISVPAKSETGGEPGDGVVDVGDLTVPGGVSVTVLVTSSAGVPIAGALVGVSQGFGRDDLRFFRVKTDRNGVAALDGLDPVAPVRMTVAKQGHVSRALSFEIPPATVPVSLSALGGIRGRVVDQEGKGVAGARVTCAGHSSASDAEGNFVLLELEPGPHTLQVTMAGFSPLRRRLGVEEGEVTDVGTLELQPGVRLHGRVVEKGSGEPVSGAAVEVVDPPDLDTAESDGEGAFEITVDGEAPTRLVIRAPGFAETPFVVDPKEPMTTEDEPRVFPIAPGGFFDIEAHKDGGPCAGCSVSVTSLGTGEALQLVTGPRGRVSSPALAEGNYRLLLEDVRSLGSVVTVSGGEKAEEAEIRSGERTPVVLGSDRRRIRVVVNPWPMGWLLEYRSGRRFGVVPPGEGGACRLEIEEKAPLDLALVNGNGTWVRLLSLPAEEIPDELALPLPEGAVRATWARPDPSGALHHVELLRQPDTLVTARCMADGATGFDVPFLRAGIYQISVDGVLAGTAAVPEGGETQLELRPDW